MTERQRNFQLSFEEKEGQLIIPANIKEKESGGELIDFLEKRKLWRERPRGGAIYLDWRNLTIYQGAELKSNRDEKTPRLNLAQTNLSAFEFNPDNWQVSGLLQKDKSYSAGLILVPFGFRTTSKLPFKLKEKAPLYLFEFGGSGVLIDGEKERRLTGLKNWGLVERKILREKSTGFIIWEGREAKERKVKPINLLDKEKHLRSYSVARKYWLEMATEYKKAGFKVISGADSEILRLLKSSVFPPRDLGKLRLGWGVEIENPSCHCHAKINLEGEVDWIYFCGEEEHHNLKRL